MAHYQVQIGGSVKVLIDTPELFYEYVVKYDRRFIKLIKSYQCLVQLHCHGKIGKILDMIASLNPDALEPIEPPPHGDIFLGEVKRKVGNKMCLIGNVEACDLSHCSEKEIDQKVKETIEDAAEGRGFILCPTSVLVLSKLTRQEDKREGLMSEEGYLPLISSDRFGRICLFWQKLTKHMDWTLQGRIYQGNGWSSLWEFEKIRQFDQWAEARNDLEGNIWLACESGRAFEDRHIYLRFIPAIIPEEEVDILQKKRLGYVKPKLVDISQEIIKTEPKSKEIFPVFPKKTIQTKEGEYKLFWGNLHVQTILSDGHCGSVDQYYLFARERYHWDFAAITDHCDSVKWLSSEWAFLQRTASLINEPGKFIAISGYEWTQGDYGKVKYGHRCIIYPTDDQPFFSALTRKAYTQGQLSNLLKGTNGLMSAHHLTRSWNGGTRWDEWDEDVEPCIEICSHWGRFEYYHNFGNITAGEEVKGCSVQDVLARRYKMGFTGGSDSHDFCHAKNDAVTLMYLKELTRADIFKALKEKRVYASTGIRIFVDFRADDHLMGEEYKTKKPPSFSMQVEGTSKLKRIDLVRNNKDIYHHLCSGKKEGFDYIDKEIPQGENYYYLRITQGDRNQAWASPIWIKY